MPRKLALFAACLLSIAAAQGRPASELKRQTTYAPTNQQMATFGAAVCAWEKARGVTCNMDKETYMLHFPKESEPVARLMLLNSVSLGAYTAPGRREALVRYASPTDYPLDRTYLLRSGPSGWQVVAATGLMIGPENSYQECINLTRTGQDTAVCHGWVNLAQLKVKGQTLSWQPLLKMPILSEARDGSADCRAGNDFKLLAWDRRDRNGDGAQDLSLSVKVDQWKVREARCSAIYPPERDQYYRKLSSKTHELIFFRADEGFRPGPQTAAFVRKYGK